MDNHEFKQKFNAYLIRETNYVQEKDEMNEDQLRFFLNEKILAMCKVKDIELTDDQRMAIVRELVSAGMSLGPLRPLMEDESITEIMINGAHQIYIQRAGRITLTDVQFESNAQLMHTVQKLLASSGSNKRVDESQPYVDFSLVDGSRVNIILPPCAVVGPVVTIRKFKDDIGSVDDLLTLGMFDKQIATFLSAAMKAKLNVIYCGSTGAGKTTIMNVFSRDIPEQERIITIEDTPELNLLQEHVVSLASKPANIEGKGEITMRDLFVNSLRMRPDRIIVGEVRGHEMLDLIQSISSGHSGSLAIVHAESPLDCFNRMVSMMLMTGINLSTAEIRKQVARAMDLIVHVELFMDGKRRVTAVTDLIYDETSDRVMLHNVFKFEQTGQNEAGSISGQWKISKRAPSFMDKFAKRMVKLPEGFFSG